MPRKPFPIIKHVKRVMAKGKAYYYFNTGRKCIKGRVIYAPLPDVADDSFWPRYGALKGVLKKREVVAGQMTVPKLINLYRKSPKWREHAPNTRRLYDSGLDYAAKVFSISPAVGIEAKDILEYRDDIADKPGMANAFVRTMGALYAWAKPTYVQHNPTHGIDPLETGEHEPWNTALLDAALACDDDLVRLAVHMLYYTTQRIGDVQKQARWQDLRGSHWTLTPQKTKKTYGEITIPLHSALRKELARHKPEGPMLFNMTVGTLRAKIKAFAADMGHDVVPHGLRKNGVIALLEAGCSVPEVAAISRQSLQVVEYYGKRRDQNKLGDAAILQWEKRS